MYNKVFITILLTLSFGNVQLSLGEYDHSTNSISVNYYSDSEIYGFQFISNQNSDVLGLTGVSGGIAEDVGFSVSSSANTGVILGFSFSGLSLPAGSHTLTNLNFEVIDGTSITEICLSDTVFSGAPGAPELSVDDGLCATYTPPPVELSLGEYNHLNNTINLYATSPYDIAGFQFQASSLSLTLADVSGGAAEEAGFSVSSSAASGIVVGFSLTGATIPAGENMLLTTLSFDVDSSDESEICISETIFSGSSGSSLYVMGPECVIYTPPPVELSLGEELVNGLVQINLNSPYSLAGFQFDISSSSVVLSSVYGGAAEEAGFQVSNGASTALGFSLTGDAIDSGSYTLTELAFEGSGTDTICLSNIILSGVGGTNLPVSSSGCQEFNFNAVEVQILEPSSADILSELIGESINVSVLGIGLSEGDHFHAYLNGEMMGMFYEDNFSIIPTLSGVQLLEVRVSNSSHEEYESEDASDVVEFAFVFKGDYNLDSQVNILDLVATTQYILFLGDSGTLQLAGADFNGDGAVNILDLVSTTQYILFN